MLKSKLPSTSRETKPVTKVTVGGFDRPKKEDAKSTDKLSVPRASQETIKTTQIEVPAIYKRIIPGLGAPLFEEDRRILADKSEPVTTPREEVKKKPVAPQAKPVAKGYSP